MWGIICGTDWVDVTMSLVSWFLAIVSAPPMLPYQVHYAHHATKRQGKASMSEHERPSRKDRHVAFPSEDATKEENAVSIRSRATAGRQALPGIARQRIHRNP